METCSHILDVNKKIWLVIVDHLVAILGFDAESTENLNLFLTSDSYVLERQMRHVFHINFIYEMHSR